MKKRSFSIVLAVMALFLTIGLSSCFQKPCEKDNFGTVVVTNHTGQVIWVDCTQEGGEFNDERMLGIGESTTYQMRPGRITEWAIEAWDYPDGSWYTDTYYLDQCETHNDPWTKKKSAKIGEPTGIGKLITTVVQRIKEQ